MWQEGEPTGVDAIEQSGGVEEWRPSEAPPCSTRGAADLPEEAIMTCLQHAVSALATMGAGGAVPEPHPRAR
jgi:hypothetical protein